MSGIDLTNKAICITGASSGIGRATAIECAKAGMRVMCTARREDRLAEVVREIRDLGGAAEHAALDVTDADRARAVIDETIERFGGIYSVFANAGYGLESPSHESDETELRDIFETNFWGTMNVLLPAIEIFKEQGGGHALICSSCLSKIGIPHHGAYCATKAAQDTMGRAMRIELAGTGVHVSTIHPIGTKTELFEMIERRSGDLKLTDTKPSLFMQSPERVARAIVRCLRKPKGEVWTSHGMRALLAFGALSPKTADRVLTHLAARRLRRSERARAMNARKKGG